MNSTFKLTLCLLISLLFLIGCTQSTPAPSPTPTFTKTIIPTVSHTPVPTLTHTPLTNTASATLTPSPSATLTPPPTPTPSPSATFSPLAPTPSLAPSQTPSSTPEPTVTSSPTEIAKKPEQIVAFVGVNVVPMDEERILEGQTVIIHDDRIAEIGAVAEVEVSGGAQVIEGQGMYLMPGLADMHVHLSDETFLLLFIANGITTVRNMSGTPQHLAWREEIANGERLGPTIYTTGPIIDGYPFYWPVRPKIETPAEAERIVMQQRQLGYDFIKVYDDLSRSAYDGLLMAAKKYEMPVVGHVPKEIDMNYALMAGQRSVEHLFGYDKVAEADLATIIATTSEKAVWNCPTLVAFQLVVPVEQVEAPRGQLPLEYMPQSMLNRWTISKEEALDKPLTYQPVDQERLALTAALHEAGAPLLLGTDTPTPYVVPGFAIHEELRNLVHAGLSPYDALKAGTRNAADFLNAEDFGTVIVGTQADLILLQQNPLADVANVAKRVGVMSRGKWLPEAQLQQMLEALVSGD